MLEKLVDAIGEVGGLPLIQGQFDSACVDLSASLEDAAGVLLELELEAEGSDNDRRYRYKGGFVPQEQKDLAHNLLLASQRLLGLLQNLEVALDERVTDTDPADRSLTHDGSLGNSNPSRTSMNLQKGLI